MTWMNGLRATFDLETTGVDVTTARIVTASLILLDAQGNVVRRGEWLADPGVEIPAGAAAVHGITTEHAREHGRPAHDFSVLHHEMLRYGIANGELPPGAVLDPYVLHKHVIPRKRGKRTLEVLAAEYGVSLENAHTSADDALAAERLLVKLTEQFPQVLNVDAHQLHEQQIQWAAEQAANFQAWLRTQPGKESEVIDGRWPVRR